MSLPTKLKIQQTNEPKTIFTNYLSTILYFYVVLLFWYPRINKTNPKTNKHKHKTT